MHGNVHESKRRLGRWQSGDHLSPALVLHGGEDGPDAADAQDVGPVPVSRWTARVGTIVGSAASQSRTANVIMTTTGSLYSTPKNMASKKLPCRTLFS